MNHLPALLCCFSLVIRVLGVSAQPDADMFSDVIEQVIQDLEGDGEFDYDAVFDRLAGYYYTPIDLNTGDLKEFVNMGLLTDAHLFALELHQVKVGPLLSVYELQSVPGFDLATIRRLRSFVTVGGDLWDYRQSLKTLILKGDNQLFVRWGRILQEQRGYAGDGSDPPDYHGDPNRFYLRYRHRNENRLSYGVTMEKDPGEDFFKGSNRQGFDFYSAHFFLHHYRKWIPRIAIGDYNINLGQGLIMHSGYGVSKSAFTTLIKKGGYTVRPYASVNEADFLRGCAVVLKPGRKSEVTFFASSRKRDANVVIDTSEFGQALTEPSFTSLQTSGLHRTDAEIQDERQITHRLAGMAWQFRHKQFRFGINGLYQHLSQPLKRADAPYNLYKFNGTSLFNASIDYTYLYKNLHFFGETALSDNGAIATVNGLLIALHRTTEVALLGRWLPRDYHTLTANPFAETTGGDNEQGLYLGIEVRPTINWSVSAYADIWKHPWLRFNVDGPSMGQEQFIRITRRKKRSYELYLQYRHEQKETNLSGNDEPFDPLADRHKHLVRLHFTYKVAAALELRTRVEGSLYAVDTRPDEHGFLIYQDILYKPIGSPVSFTARLALFDSDSYDAAIYAYENDLVNQFYIPAYAYQGVRYYLNLRYRGIRNLSFEFRFAQTRYADRDEIGSGNDLIQGSVRTDLKAQIIWNF